MSFDVHDEARFWSKVDVSDSEKECWDWRARVDRSGYGEVKVRYLDKSCRAHRVAYAMFASQTLEQIDGLVLRHSCDRPICCNPFHLSTGTHNDNVADRVRRGRSAIGTGNGNHKLTEEQVIAILSDERSNRAIANVYGVHTDTIRLIKIGKTWRHLFTADNDNAPKHTPVTVNS